MGQQLQSWRSGDGERLWLSMLVAAMEKTSSPDFVDIACSTAVLASVQAHLAQPASRGYVSPYSLRN
jgi:biotin-(acetyl-CoA carboxylase) ligase